MADAPYLGRLGCQPAKILLSMVSRVPRRLICRVRPSPGPKKIWSFTLNYGTITLILTLKVYPHGILETIDNKLLADWTAAQK